MELFIIIFTIALLFVIGSAGMMRFFDSRMVVRKKPAETKDDSNEDGNNDSTKD